MKLSTLAIGAAGGYAVARALEAISIGLPLATAFRLDSIWKPVSAVQKLQGSVALTAAQQANVIDVTPIPVPTSVSGY